MLIRHDSSTMMRKGAHRKKVRKLRERDRMRGSVANQGFHVTRRHGSWAVYCNRRKITWKRLGNRGASVRL
jgi:hypothetical protein